MARILQILALWLAVLSVSVMQAAATTLRRGFGGGDDGGMAGLGGALAGMLGGGGGGGGDDDDPNMVGGNKKKSGGGATANGGVDLNGLESGLKNGGIGGLMGMLSAMRAAQGNQDNHIVKGRNGEDMYDFRDLDDGTTTAMPTIKVAETITMPPVSTGVAVPEAPKISLPGRDGKVKGLAAQDAQLKAEAQANLEANKAAPAANAGKFVVWPPAKSAAPQSGQPQTPQVPPQFAQPAPVAAQFAQPQPASMAAPMQAPMYSYPPMQAPMSFAAPMMAPIAPGSSANGLYQGLAMLRQNMDTLLGEAASMGLGSGASFGGGGGDPQLASKIDQLSQSFATEEKKLEDKVETLETENKDMKKELTEQETEIKALGGKGKGEVSQDKVEKTKAVATIRTTLDTYATEPWNATFKVHLDGTSSGEESSFTVMVHPDWAPEGAKRFQDIIKDGLFKDARFFRVVPGFMVQFGIPGDPKVAVKWVKAGIKDDPPKMSNKRGYMTFATSGPNTRTTQMFVNYVDNTFLDKQGFTPFAEVLGDGMEIVDHIQSKYKERPNQGKIQHHGNKYLMKHFPDLSFVSHVDASFLVPPSSPSSPKAAGGFLQDSNAAAKSQDQSLRYGGIATFFHKKQKVAD